MTVKVKNTPKKKTSKKKTVVLIILIVLAAILCISLALGAWLYTKVPELDFDRFNYAQTTVLLDKNGQGYQNLQGEENRRNISLTEIPVMVQNAFISIEDQRYYTHHGVDPRGIARAVLGVFRSGGIEGAGGSTITQQLIKLTQLNSEKTIERKFNEWVMALRLEQVYDKSHILELYLNKINFNGVDGIEAAANQYFNKEPAALTIAQAAILAAIPNAPSYFDPYTYNDEGHIIKNEAGQIVLNPHNQYRAGLVISKMLELGKISQTEADNANAELTAGAGLVYVDPNITYSYFTDAVYDQVLSDLQTKGKFKETEAINLLKSGGLNIYTTVDPAVQSQLEASAADDSLFPAQSDAAAQASNASGTSYTPQVGMTVVNNHDGSIAGIVGGREKNTNLSLNRATSRFPTGSCTKPLTVYGPALEEKKITLATVFNDAPLSYAGWQPTNADGTNAGPLTIRQGLAGSINTIAVQTWAALGVDKSAEYAKRLGLDLVESGDANDRTGASLALGGYVNGQTTLDMAAAFAAFPNEGNYIEPYLYTKVTDKDGNVIIDHTVHQTQVFSPQTAYLITNVLEQAVHGDTTNIAVGSTEVAGKTGTTDEERHAWFCGYTPNYSMAVWYGYDQNMVTVGEDSYALNIGIFGGELAGPAGMFQSVMNGLDQNAKSTFNTPENLVKTDIDKTSGLLADSLTDADPRGSQRISEIFTDSTVPKKYDDVHVSVSIDSTTGQRATDNCPKTNIIQKILIDPKILEFHNGITSADSSFVPTSLSGILTTSIPTCTAHPAS